MADPPPLLPIDTITAPPCAAHQPVTLCRTHRTACCLCTLAIAAAAAEALAAPAAACRLCQRARLLVYRPEAQHEPRLGRLHARGWQVAIGGISGSGSARIRQNTHTTQARHGCDPQPPQCGGCWDWGRRVAVVVVVGCALIKPFHPSDTQTAHQRGLLLHV